MNTKTRSEKMDKNEIAKQFSKHYKRLEEDLKQIIGFTPIMMKVVSFNLKNLENDVLRTNEERENGNTRR